LIRTLPGRSGRLVERNLLVYRRGWLIIFSGFFEPLFYLLGIGFGLGGLVGPVSTDQGLTVSYAIFVAPALMATAAMNGAIYDSTFNLFFKLRYARTYDAVLATPVGVGAAVTTFLRKWQDFDLVQIVLLPIFLFSATFFPLSVYPPALQAVVQLTPLFHGVHLIRGLTTGGVDWTLLLDVAYLGALGLAGLALTTQRLRHQLLK